MATTDLETDADVGLAPPAQAAPSASAAPLESDEDVGLNQQLLEHAQTVTPWGMAGEGLAALRRVAEAKLGLGTPERGTTLPEIQRGILREHPTLGGQLTEGIVHYQPYKVEKDDHVLTAIGKEAANVAVSIPEFFTSPLGVVTPALGATYPITTGLAFTADMLYNLGKGLVSTVKGWSDMSTGQKAASIVDLGANGIMALAVGHGTVRAGEEALFKPAEGRTVPPEVKAWAQTFGWGTGEPETGIRGPQARVVPTQPYVGPEPGPMQPIPRPEEGLLLSRDEANMQGPEAINYIMAKFQVDRDTAVSIQQANRSRLGITRTPASTPTERPTDVTTGIGQLSSSQETQLPGIREGQNVPTDQTEIRQTPSGQAEGGGGPVPSPQGQAAPTPPDVVLAPPAPTPAPASVAPAAPAPAGPVPIIPPRGPKAEFTSENLIRGRDLKYRIMAVIRTRELTPEQRATAVRVSQQVDQGYFTETEEALPQLEAAPIKQKPVAQRSTAITRFGVESAALKASIGEEDILDWIHQNMKMLSRSGAKSYWGNARYEQNTSLWDDAPDDLPIHHEMAIYGGKNGPDTVLKALVDEGKLPQGSTLADMWRAIDHASKTRRGAATDKTVDQASAFDKFSAATQQAEGKTQIDPELIVRGDRWMVQGQEVRVIRRTDEGDVLLDGGEKFGTFEVPEGEPIWVDSVLEQAPEGDVDFAPEPEPAAAPQLPTRPGPAGTAETPEGREAKWQEHLAALDKYNADLAAWEAAQPQNRPIIFRSDNGSYHAITRDPLGGWRVETFVKLYSDLDKLAPWGHERYNTRLEAVRATVSGNELADRLPFEVMTEEEIAAENAKRNPPPPAAPAPAREIEPIRLSKEVKKFKKSDWDKLEIVSEPTGKQAQIRIDEDGTRWSWKRSNPSNVWADRVLPEREIITPANDRKIGVNDAGEQLYERADGSVYRMRFDRPTTRPNGYPDFGGDLSPVEPPPAAPPVTPPTLRPGEQQGDIFAQSADQPFNLAGGSTVDADRIAAERAAAEARAKEAADLAAKQQPELPKKPTKFGGTTPAGTRVDNYEKGDDGRWYLLNEDGTRKRIGNKDPIPVNDKKHQDLETRAGLPPAPAETRSPLEILSQAKRVRITIPAEATIVRAIDAKGRISDEFIARANKGINSFEGTEWREIQAGFINSKGKFQRVEGEVKVEDVSRQKLRSIATETPATHLPVEQVEAHIAEQFGVQPGGMIEVINNPGVEWNGEADLDTGKIRINAAKISSAAELQEVVEHELAHGAAEQLGSTLQGLTDAELQQITKDIQSKNYPASDLDNELRARTITTLADSWKGRNWFEKAVGTVMAWANKAGLPLTRLAAERIAARAIADQLTLVKRGSAINPPAVERLVHSLALKPEDWNMKQFFNTIGLQAATIGGYLHRYTRQVFHADALEVSDRARSLEGMNEARQLTELAQGMGGRVNFYDAIANAATQGERNEVLRSAVESYVRYQQRGIDLRNTLAEKQKYIQSEKFRNKLTQRAQKAEKAETAEEARRTFTLQMAASAGRIMQTLNDLRTVGATHEQLQADLARVQQMPGFENAVAQHFDSIVNLLSQTDRGLSLLLGGGERTGQDIWDQYMRQRFDAGHGIPQGNEFTLGQLASNVLAANRDLRNEFASRALLARDIVTTQEWNRAGSMIAQSLQNDPTAAIPRILQRAGRLGEREGRAEAAWLAMNRDIEHTLRDYNDYEQAVGVHNAVEADGEYRQWVNDVLNNPAVQGLAIPEDVRARMEGKKEPYFKYSGAERMYAPQGNSYQIDLGFTRDTLQATMSDLVKLSADISTWLDAPENQNNPSRLYWQERQRLVQGTLMSAAVHNPTAIKPLFGIGSWGMPEFFYQRLALPAAKLAALAQKAFDRYYTQGIGWFGSHHDKSESLIQTAYKSHGFNELNRKDYQQGILNAIAWEFRNGHEVRAGDIINGHRINAHDIDLLYSEGRMTSDLYDRMWNTAKASGAQGVMELPRILDEFTGAAWGLRRAMEIGIHKNTTLPHNFSDHGSKLAAEVHGLIGERIKALEKLPQRVIDEGLTPDQQNAERTAINKRFYDALAFALDDTNRFQNAVLGFMRQRAENWVKLDGLSPFEEHYREMSRMIAADDPTAPKKVAAVLDYLNRHVSAEDWSPEQVRAQFFKEWEALTERFYKMQSDREASIKIQSDKRTTAFTQGFQHDLGPAYFYDYGWMNASEMSRYGTDMMEFGFERNIEAMRALRKDMDQAMSSMTGVSKERKAEIVKRTKAQYKAGNDFRDLQRMQDQAMELDKLIAGMPVWIGATAPHASGAAFSGGFHRFVSFMIGAALTGPRTAARISGISMGGSAWKMGLVFQQLGYGRMRSFPAAAASAITSAFRVGTATGLGWYHPGKGFVPGVPMRILLNVPSAAKAALAKQGSDRIYSAIETILKGTTDEQFAALGWWFDQKKLGMTPDVALGSRIANILSASRTRGGMLSRPEPVPAGGVLARVKLGLSKPWAIGEAFVAGTNVYLPGAFGYNITYDAVARQAGWYIDMLAANARRTFETYERLGQLDRFNFNNLRDPQNSLQPWEVLPTFAHRFINPERLPAWARPNSTNLAAARELFSTSTDVDLQDLMLRYWDRLRRTAPDQRKSVEFLAPEEMDAAKATEKAEGRARGVISRFVEQTHHAAPANRPYQMHRASSFQAILPFMGWSAQTLQLINSTLGKVAFSAEARGVQADTYAGLVIAAALTGLGVSAFAFAGGDLEARMIRELDRLLHHKEGTVKTIDEARDMKEAAEITLHNMTAGIPMLNSTLNQLFGATGYRGGNVGFQAFAFDKVNSMLTYARDVYRTHDLTHGLDRLAEANIPISEAIIENTFQREGLQNNRNAVRVLQKFGPQDLVERRASLSIALPTEMTPYRQALVEAIGSGDQALVAKTYEAFIEKATELGRTDPDKLARQMFSTLNPYRQAFGGVLTDQQRADTLAKMSPVQRKMVETMEQNYGLAAATLGLASEFEKQDKAPPVQRAGAGGGGGLSLGPVRGATGAAGGISRIGTGLRRVSLSGPRAPRIRLPGGLGGIRGSSAAKSRSYRAPRYVHGRLTSRSSRARRLTAGRSRRRRLSLAA